MPPPFAEIVEVLLGGAGEPGCDNSLSTHSPVSLPFSLFFFSFFSIRLLNPFLNKFPIEFDQAFLFKRISRNYFSSKENLSPSFINILHLNLKDPLKSACPKLAS